MTGVDRDPTGARFLALRLALSHSSLGVSSERRHPEHADLPERAPAGSLADLCWAELDTLDGSLPGPQRPTRGRSPLEYWARRRNVQHRIAWNAARKILPPLWMRIAELDAEQLRGRGRAIGFELCLCAASSVAPRDLVEELAPLGETLALDVLTALRQGRGTAAPVLAEPARRAVTSSAKKHRATHLLSHLARRALASAFANLGAEAQQGFALCARSNVHKLLSQELPLELESTEQRTALDALLQHVFLTCTD